MIGVTLLWLAVRHTGKGGTENLGGGPRQNPHPDLEGAPGGNFTGVLRRKY